MKTNTSRNSNNQNNKSTTSKRNAPVPDIEKVKAQIKEYQKNNAQLSTQVTREKKLFDKKILVKEELLRLIEKSKAPKQLEHAPKAPIDQEKLNKAKQLMNTICICGASDPKFKGYCGNCLQKLKEEYKKALEDYLPVQEEYEQIYQKNLNMKSKMIKMKKKIQKYKEQMKNPKLEPDDDDQEYETKKMVLFAQEKVEILTSDIELLTANHNRVLQESKLTQEQIEKRLSKKLKKMKEIQEDIDNYDNKIQFFEQKIKEFQGMLGKGA